MNGDRRNFLFVSLSGLISDIAWQVAKEGHAVKYFIADPKERDIADTVLCLRSRIGSEKSTGPMSSYSTIHLGKGKKRNPCAPRASA